VTGFLKQHLIDPELCIRCYTCEEICAINAISHDDNNVVVDMSKCQYCMDCIAPCPTGSIDNWRIVTKPYSIEEQYEWLELPEQEEQEEGSGGKGELIEALDEDVAALLAQAHLGAGGKAMAPLSASKPTVNLHSFDKPVEALVQGTYRLTQEGGDGEVHHIILDLGADAFPVLEGQSIGIIAPGTAKNGKPHLPRLYSISSPRDGERPNTNNLSLAIKRHEHGLCSNYMCGLQRGDKVNVTGPFGASFLLPEDPRAKLIMICTGTGSAPFRGFTMRRQRTMPDLMGGLKLFFGAQSPETLPYFQPLKKIPDAFLEKHFAYSRLDNEPKEYVQDKLRAAASQLAPMLKDPDTYIYICGLKAMEEGVEHAFEDIAQNAGMNWKDIRDQMREAGRYHVETY